MKFTVEKITLISKDETELIDITDKVKEIVRNANIKSGFCNIYSLHTTTAVTINEGLECLEKDIAEFLQKIVPEELPYFHAHFLPQDGRLGVNAYCHLRSSLFGINYVIPIENGELLLGGRQKIYFIELDGPKKRKVAVQIGGE